MIDTAVNILLLIVLIVDFILAVQMIYNNHKNHQEDIKFYKKQEEISNKLLADLETKINKSDNE